MVCGCQVILLNEDVMMVGPVIISNSMTRYAVCCFNARHES